MTENKENPRRALGLLLLFLALLYSGWMMGHTMGQPFKTGYLGKNGARYAIMARNALRCDLTKACYAPLFNAEGEETPDPYLHHPPLLHWVIAGVFALAGETEDHARLVPYIFTLLNIVLIFFLGRRLLHGLFWGGVCAFVFAALPMTGFYGIHIDVQGSPLVCCILACVLCYWKWLDTDKTLWLLLCCVYLLVGTLFDWPALYLCVLFPFHLWRQKKTTLKTAFKRTAPIIACGVILFLALAAWLSFAGSAKGTSLWESIKIRMIQPSTSSFIPIEDSEKWEIIKHELKNHCGPNIHSLYPWPFLILIVLGFFLGFKNKVIIDRAMLSLFLILGFCHLVLFPFGLLYHDYWTFLLAPWAAFYVSLSLARMSILLRGNVKVLVLWGLMGGIGFSGYHWTMERINKDDAPEAYLFGNLIHERTQPGDAVLTNAPYNPPLDGPGDRYSISQPALTYYADRVIRGLIRTPEEFDQIFKRRDDFKWFFFISGTQNQSDLYKYLVKKYQAVEHTGWGVVFRLKP